MVGTLGNLKVNGEALKSPGVVTSYLESVPDYADAKASGGAVVIKVGKSVENGPERRVRLVGG